MVEPGITLQGERGGALVDVALQHQLEELLGGGAESRLDRLLEGVEALRADERLPGRPKGQTVIEGDVHADAQTPDVRDDGVVGDVGEDLRGEVRHRGGVYRLQTGAVLHNQTVVEVGEDGAVVPVQQHVLQLQIAMGDLVLVHVRQAGEGAGEDAAGVVLLQRPIRLEQLGDAALGAVLGDDAVGGAVHGGELVHPGDACHGALRVELVVVERSLHHRPSHLLHGALHQHLQHQLLSGAVLRAQVQLRVRPKVEELVQADFGLLQVLLNDALQIGRAGGALRRAVLAEKSSRRFAVALCPVVHWRSDGIH